MDPELQCLKVEPLTLSYYQFTIQHAAHRQLLPQRFEQFREITVQRFFVATLYQDLVPIAEDQRAKSIPFRLEHPPLAGGYLGNSLREHRQNRRIHGKLHVSNLLPSTAIRKLPQPRIILSSDVRNR